MRSTDYVPRTTDRAIRIEQATPSRDGSGAEILTWGLLCTRWASMRYASGSENTSSQKETASASVIFTTRYISGITEKDRLVYDSKNYDIIQINEIGRRHYHEIITEYRR